MTNALRTNTFSPSDAALSVFELTKRQPQFVLRFCIIYALISMIGIAIMAGTGVGGALLEYQAIINRGGQPDPTELMEALSPASPGLALSFLFSLPAGAIATAMALRKALFDREEGVFGLQFGGDEIRLLIASVIVSVILFAIGFGVTVLGSFIAMGNVAAALLAGIVALIFTAIVGTRLSLYGVLTIAQGQVSIAETWHATKGQVMRFVGAFVLWSIIYLILSLLFGTIGSVLGGALGAQINGNVPETLALYFTPGWLVYSLISGLLAGYAVLGYVCIGGFAWHQMRGDLPVNSG